MANSRGARPAVARRDLEHRCLVGHGKRSPRTSASFAANREERGKIQSEALRFGDESVVECSPHCEIIRASLKSCVRGGPAPTSL